MNTTTKTTVDPAQLLGDALIDYVAASLAGLLPGGRKAPVATTARFQAQWLEQNGYKLVRIEEDQ